MSFNNVIPGFMVRELFGVDEIRIREEDDDDYPCLDEQSCGAVCEGACYSYGSEAAYP